MSSVSMGDDYPYQRYFLRPWRDDRCDCSLTKWGEKILCLPNCILLIYHMCSNWKSEIDRLKTWDSRSGNDGQSFFK